MKFKIGDKVKMIKKDDNYRDYPQLIGRVLTVTTTCGNFSDLVEFEDSNSIAYAHRFELVKEKLSYPILTPYQRVMTKSRNLAIIIQPPPELSYDLVICYKEGGFDYIEFRDSTKDSYITTVYERPLVLRNILDFSIKGKVIFKQEIKIEDSEEVKALKAEVILLDQQLEVCREAIKTRILKYSGE